jgi:hypothetical protein
MSFVRILLFFLLLGSLLLSPTRVVADGSSSRDGASLRETLEVKRAEFDERKYESLRFLRDNRAFLRAQFDQLRMEIGYERDGEAEMIDERLLLLQQLSAEIAAARDTVRGEHDRTLRRDLLTSVEELAELESQLELFEELLVDQQNRLLTLEADFLGHQKTALVVVVRGVPETGTPTALLLQEEDTTLRVDLDAAQAAALDRGGVAQIYHEFVEPRVHRLELRLEGEGWEGVAPTVIELETPRDQLTFLELDLAALDRDDPEARLETQVWQR